MHLGIVGRVQLDETLDVEASEAEEVDPLAVADVELEAVLVIPLIAYIPRCGR